MQKQNRYAGLITLAIVPFLGLASCSKSDQKTENHTPSSESQTITQDRSTENKSSAFNIENIPISTVTLGDFPYIALPEGYQFYDGTSVNFEKTPFWTGQNIEFIEGKLYSAIIKPKENHKEGSFLELQRNIEDVIKQLGGQKIVNSQISKADLDKIPEKFRVDYVSGLGDIYNNPTETFLIRQADKNIWLQLTQSGSGAGLLVAETKALQITAKALTSDQLLLSLDKENKVNVQVNFSSDKADILPESKPQIDQIIQLLKNHPQLKLGVYGHTDHSGDAKHNQLLSQLRAESVVKALTNQTGIESARLSSKGFGDSNPIADNSTVEGQALNRRVELVKME